MFRDILGILQKYPHARYEHGGESVRVFPRTSQEFAVIIEQIWENHFTVSYDRWHQDFYTLEEALDCFFFGLSKRCRLKVQSKNSVPFAWTVEYWDESQWRERSAKSSWTYRFWTPTTTAYLQNDLLLESDLHPFRSKFFDEFNRRQEESLEAVVDGSVPDGDRPMVLTAAELSVEDERPPFGGEIQSTARNDDDFLAVALRKPSKTKNQAVKQL